MELLSTSGYTNLRMLGGKVAAGSPAKGLDQAFAAKVQISPSMWSQIKSARPIGNQLARQIETLCEQPLGWLDEDHADSARPDEAEESFIALAREAWRAANARGKRTLLTGLRHTLAALAGRGPT